LIVLMESAPLPATSSARAAFGYLRLVQLGFDQRHLLENPLQQKTLAM
jgi:hypothetical protein